MKKTMKKMISTICLAAFILSLTIPAAFAHSGETQDSATITMTEEMKRFADMIDHMSNSELCEFFVEQFHVSESEALQLVALESGRGSRASTMKFPSNPKIGDKHTETYLIDITTTATALELAGDLVQNYNLTWGLAITLAGMIIDAVSGTVGVSMVEIKVTYVYGETNDGLIDWNVGPATIKVY